MISVYSDGSSSGKSQKPGGYGYVVVSGDWVLAWGHGGSPRTTNNLMEMEGAIQGLQALLELDPAGPRELVSDSKYVLGLASGKYSPSKNISRAEELLRLAQATRVRCRWVRGHSGDPFNEICDTLAKSGKAENSTL